MSTWNRKWTKDTVKGRTVYKLRRDLCPEGIGIIVVPRDGAFAIAATYNRQRFYLMSGDSGNVKRTYAQLSNAKTFAEQFAPTAIQVKEL